MDNYDKELLMKGLTLAFGTFEKASRIVLGEMMLKSTEVIRMTLTGESESKEEEFDALKKSIEKDQEKIKKLNELVKLKEEYIKLLSDEE